MAVEWYCRLMGSELGPLTKDELLEMARSFRLTPEDLVRKGANGRWMPGYSIHGLFGPDAQSPAPAPKEPTESEPEPAEEPVEQSEPPPKPAAVQWFYISEGKKLGPMAFESLKAHAADGSLHPDDRVWTSITPKWLVASKVEGLQFDG